MQPFFIFFDTETDGHGGFQKPLRHSLMQLAWVVTDVECNVISGKDYLVKGEHRVSAHVPHSLTNQYVNTFGLLPRRVLNEFLDDVDVVCANGGKVVAHNKSYDLQVIDYALSLIEPPLGRSVNMDCTFCSMSNPSIIRFCGIPRGRGLGLKFPKLSELYGKCHNGKSPPYMLHDAMGDVKTLSDSFKVLLLNNVISFASSASPCSVVSRSQNCDVCLNASDVATVTGFMTRFDKYPFEIAQRVLEKYGGILGKPFPPPLEGRVKLNTDVKREIKEKVRTTSTIGNASFRVEEIVRDVVRTKDEEVLKEVRSEVKRALGTHEETKVVKENGITSNNNDTYYLYGGPVASLKWGFVGKIDGFLPDGRLVEIKNRTKRIFTSIPTYERMQLEVYMRMTSQECAVLLQKFGEVTCDKLVAHQDDEIWSFIVSSCGDFMSKLNRLIKTEEHWTKWCESNEWAKRREVWDNV
jgi:DNA polymerase III epsilon subunit-like protein